MVVSWNRVTSKLSILMGCSLLNQPFWDTPIYGNPHISEKTLKIDQRNVTIDHQPVREICRHIPSVLKHQMQNWQTLESTIPKQHGHDVQHFWCFRHRKRNISSLFKSMMLKQHFQNKKKQFEKFWANFHQPNFHQPSWHFQSDAQTTFPSQLCQFSSAQGLLLPSAQSCHPVASDVFSAVRSVALIGACFLLVDDKSLQYNMIFITVLYDKSYYCSTNMIGCMCKHHVI